MKFLRNKFFILATFAVFALLLIEIYFCGTQIGVSVSESRQIVIEAILMLLATFLAVSLPLYADTEAKRQRKNEELRNSYISIARYLGEELANNIVRVEDIKSNNEKTIKELDQKFPNATEEEKALRLVAIWKAAADDLLIGLEDINHRSLIMSGILTKVPDNEMNSEIKNSYSKMINLKQTLRRLSIFFGMILTPPSNFPPQIITELLTTKVPDSIKTSKEDLDIFLECAKVAIEQINKTIKPYGKEIKIITYHPKKKHD